MSERLLGAPGCSATAWMVARAPRHLGGLPRTTVRRPLDPAGRGGVDLTRDEIRRLLDDVAPTVVVNAAGLVKQRPEGSDPVAAMAVNALLPHRLSARCRASGARLLHVSTDCVFSGARGRYTEADSPDPVDLYGRSKWLGEVATAGCLTLRLSLVGWELGTRRGLVEWFRQQVVAGAREDRGTRAPFRRPDHRYGGAAAGLAGRAAAVARRLFHVAAAPISKRTLSAGRRPWRRRQRGAGRSGGHRPLARRPPLPRGRAGRRRRGRG